MHPWSSSLPEGYHLCARGNYQASSWRLGLFTSLFGCILNYEIACHRISLTLPCQTCLTGFLAKMVRNSRWSRSYSQKAILMTKRDTILFFCRQKAPQLTWLSLEIADVRPTPSVRVSVLQKERRSPRGILLYCACSSRTWPAATAFDVSSVIREPATGNNLVQLCSKA